MGMLKKPPAALSLLKGLNVLLLYTSLFSLPAALLDGIFEHPHFDLSRQVL